VRLRELAVAGSFVVEPAHHEDERGSFARIFDADEFARAGLSRAVAQCSVAFNRAPWTLRGLHYQKPPHEEAKLVRCTRGAAFDVVVDLRAASPTHLHWDAVELTADNRLGLYVPEGCAHGYLTLEEATELAYQISHVYVPEAGRGVRWNDPLFAIEWPAAPRVISPRDSAYADYVPTP
jgi:dTDP-4-dehydrorhamnose 3,5-epimerase